MYANTIDYKVEGVRKALHSLANLRRNPKASIENWPNVLETKPKGMAMFSVIRGKRRYHQTPLRDVACVNMRERVSTYRIDPS